MFATQVLPETSTNDSEENSYDIIGLIIVNGKEYELKRGETKIGRDPTMCSIVIENSTVSKVHATVESEGVDDTFIYDVGSTNQTKLGKKVLRPHCRYKLDDKSIITLGNITAKFVIPPDKGSYTNSQEARPGPFDELNDLGDIFDIPTQVSVPQPSSSSTKDFDGFPENFEISRIPNSGSLAFKPSRSCFDKDTQGRLDSQRTKQRTVFGSFENPGIFSLGTQYQLYEHLDEGEKCIVQKVPSDENKNKNSELDEIKSLLDDGQDEVLCTFMSLHSPKEEGKLLKEIKTEILTQDAPTEAEKIQESVEEKERRELSKILKDEDLTEDFAVRSMPSITSTPLSGNLGQFKIPDRNDSHKEHPDEDFIRTQEFNVNRSESSKRREVARDDRDSLPEDAETQPYVGNISNELPTSQQRHDDEDLILTQAFQASEKHPENKQAPMVIPETEETVEFKEDFLETQIFPAEAGGLGGESGVGGIVNMTERNDEDDFIETQVFEDGGRSDARSDRSDDEDFIATQRVDSSVNRTSGQDGISTVRDASRESSPDLLTAETSRRNSEDCISTQIFEPVVHQNPVTDVLVSEKDNCDVARTQNAGSSGDETESDLEIILEKKETGRRFIKCEPIKGSPRVSEVQENDESTSSYIFGLGPRNQSVGGNQEENSRPVAQQQSDSDETDCEEMEITSPAIQVKLESKVVSDEIRVLPRMLLPDDYAEKAVDDWGMDAESPKFIADSPLSLEMPNTQDIEATMNRMLGNDENKDFKMSSKTEVGLTKGSVTSSRGKPLENPVDTPLKRPRDNSGVEIVPVKKYKTENSSDRLLRSSEKQFAKLVQAHDITQIQPSRTRNSLKNITTEREVRLGNNISNGNIAQIRASRTKKSPKNISTEREVRLRNNINNDRPTSRRKSNPKKGGRKNQNGDITSYLTRKVERKPSPNENRPVVGTDRVLRSSMKKATATILTTSPERTGRRSRRSSRTKTDEYFSRTRVNVMFTGFDCEMLESIISDLGGRKTNDLSSGEVVVSDKVRRTVKFLSAIGLSLPIVSPQWLLSSKKEKKFLNPWNFILKDEESEKRWDFELRASLEKAKRVKLFKGFSVFATKSTKPPVKDLLAIVEFCGGTPLFDPPDVWPKKTIIVSCPEDKKWWPLVKSRNIKIVHYEFFLSGVLRQEIDFKMYKLR